MVVQFAVSGPDIVQSLVNIPALRCGWFTVINPSQLYYAYEIHVINIFWEI